MSRFKNTLFTGICILSICLTGNANLSLAQDKQSPDVLTTCICNQVPLYPVGTTLWAWMAYKYEYESDCTTATAVSIINYSDYEAYPETLCKDTGSCGSECAIKGVPSKKTIITTEPMPAHYLHSLPASASAKFDLYPPQIDLNYHILETRYFMFKETSFTTRYAKVFFVRLAPGGSTSITNNNVYFWYGFEVDSLPSDEVPITVAYSNTNRRAIFIKKDKDGKLSEGRCREFSLMNYGGSQYLIRFRDEAADRGDCSDCKASKEEKKKK